MQPIFVGLYAGGALLHEAAGDAVYRLPRAVHQPQKRSRRAQERLHTQLVFHQRVLPSLYNKGREVNFCYLKSVLITLTGLSSQINIRPGGGGQY